jgi:hypothetical protein
MDELDVGPLLHTSSPFRGQSERGMVDAIDSASDQNRMCWLTDGPSGRRLAAIVPVDLAEVIERRLTPDVPVGRHAADDSKAVREANEAFARLKEQEDAYRERFPDGRLGPPR